MNPPVESRISANPLGCKAPALAMALLCFLGLGVRRANAAGYTWDANTSSAVITDGTGIWSTSANDWVTAGVESAWLGGDAQIGGAGLTGTNSISLSGNISVGNLYIAPNTSGTITDDASDALTISGSMTAGHAFTISGPVFFTDGLLNSSTVTIGGVTTSSGNSTITISGSVNVTGGGISESDSNGGVTINGPEVGATSIAVTNGTLTMSGSVAALSGGISVANGNLTLSGTTEGAASITITSGNLTLSGSNAALSGTIGISGGTLNMNGIYASNFATNITQSNGTLEVNGTTFPTFTGTWGMSGGTLQVGGGAFTTAIGTGAGQLNITGNVTLAISGNQTGTFNFGSGEMLTWGTGGFNPGNTLTLNPNNQSTMTFANSIDLNGATRTIQDQANGYGTGDLILSGTLQNSGAAANLIITMSNQRSQGDNWVELTGSNTYTGTTFIAGSTATTGNNNPMRLVLDASGSFSSATYYITGTDGGQLQIMPGTGSGGTTYVSGNITNTGTDNVTNPGGNAYTYDAGYVLIIGGTGTPNGLASGTGVVVLTGTNTYTGSTLIKSFLRRNRCDQMQGYFFSRPLPAPEFNQMLKVGKSLSLSADFAGARKTLMIVESDANVAAALNRVLRVDDYHILLANNPDEAFELLALNEVHVVIADQRLIHISGTEFLTRVKNLYPDTVRILLSGFTALESVIEAINRGEIYRFFTKPWDDASLQESVRDAFRHYWQVYHANRVAEETSA